MTKSNFFFWGIVSDEEAAEMWQILHDHFARLSGEDANGCVGENDDGIEAKEEKK